MRPSFKHGWYFFVVRLLGALRVNRPEHTSIMENDAFTRGRLASCLAFFAAGIATAPWASIVPYVKIRLNLDEMHYASLVLCFGLGAVVGMPLTGRLAARFGVKPIILLSMIGLYVGMVGLSLEGLNLPLTFCCVLLWGMSLGIVDVANNIHAAYIEELSGRHLMSGFHAWYTVGCIAAALFCALLLPAGLHTSAVTLLLSLSGVILLMLCFPRLYNTHGGEDVSTKIHALNTEAQILKQRTYLTPAICVIGFICLIMYLTEGMVYDWSGVYLITNGGVDITIASCGYLAFETAMALMRFKGDAIVTKAGPFKLITAGGVCAAISMAVIAMSSNPLLMVIAFFTAGLSLGNVVPIMLSETARRSGIHQGRAIAFVGTVGYAGLLFGPGVMGAAATLLGLSGMYVVTAALIVILTLCAIFVLRPNKS